MEHETPPTPERPRLIVVKARATMEANRHQRTREYVEMAACGVVIVGSIYTWLILSGLKRIEHAVVESQRARRRGL